MENLPDHLYEDYSQLTFTSSSSASSSSAPAPTVLFQPDLLLVCRWITDLGSLNPVVSDFALQNLVNHRDNIEILPRLLWNSHLTVSMLLQEITLTSVQLFGLPYYPPLQSMRMYNILVLFQGIAQDPETRTPFLKAKIPHYIYPLMDIGPTDRNRESVRLAALGVIAHLLTPPLDGDAIRFLMDTGAFNYCIKPLDFGSVESKTVATFILQNIMSTDQGLQYCAVLPDRFFAIDDILKKLLIYLSNMERPSPSLFRLVISCYAKLSSKPRAREGLRRFTPVLLLNGTFANLLAEDSVADDYRKQLIHNLENPIELPANVLAWMN